VYVLQIYQLMKQDSYCRFLKSDLYKSYMMCEMEGRPLVAPGNTPSDPLKVVGEGEGKDGKKKSGKGGKENSEDKSEKRRRSLLPWRQSEWQSALLVNFIL